MGDKTERNLWCLRGCGTRAAPRFRTFCRHTGAQPESARATGRGRGPEEVPQDLCRHQQHGAGPDPRGSRHVLSGDSAGGGGQAGSAGISGGASREPLFPPDRAVIGGEDRGWGSLGGCCALERGGRRGLDQLLVDTRRGAVPAPGARWAGLSSQQQLGPGQGVQVGEAAPSGTRGRP